MKPKRRTMLFALSGMVGAVGLTVAMFRLYAVVPSWPSQISTISPVVAEPILAADGRPLTRWVDRTALLVNPLKVPAPTLQELEHAMRVRRLGKQTVLWITSVANRRRLRQTVGIEAVTVRVLVPTQGVSPQTLEVVAKASLDWAKGPWDWSRGQYRVSLSKPDVDSTLNRALTSDLGTLGSDSGTALIVNHRGAMVALATGTGTSLWKRHTVGQVLLPAMLALALKVPKVRHTLEQKGVSLRQVAESWGADGVRRGLQSLGLSVRSTLRLPVPSAKMMMTAFGQGSYVMATPLQLAQSYLPFVSDGRMGPVTVRRQTHPSGHPVNGDFARILGQLPAITLSGTSFRVWRPAGNYAVVIAPEEQQVAILEGDWVDKTVSVMQVMGDMQDQSWRSRP